MKKHILAVLSLVLLVGLPHGGGAQQTIDFVQELDFDEPEAWAMKLFTSVGLLTSVGALEERAPGELELGFEAISIPHLDQEQRTVGFGGFKEEDLNRSPVAGRVRLTLGLPHRFSLTLGYSPSIEVDGAEAELIALGLENVVLRRGPWSLGVRVYAQLGEAEGDFTCTAGGDELFPPGSAENPFGCGGPSSDMVTMDSLGLEFVAGYRFSAKRAPALHFGAAVNRLDMEFQVHALTFGALDRTRLLAEGETVSFTAGATWDLGQRSHLGVELFYSPLEVERREQASENDPLWNVRAMWRYKVRRPRP